MNPPTPPRKPLVVKTTSKRDTIIAIVIGVALLAGVIYGVGSMGKPHESQNILKGIIVDKKEVSRKEEQISFNKNKLEGAKQIDGEYTLQVRVEKENRVYEVPVEKAAYESRKVGDTLEFVRPRSEQR